ncbi:MAG: hypothetical protein N2595_09530 [bacterium]|nr:hypothetical protein [bacterium]
MKSETAICNVCALLALPLAASVSNPAVFVVGQTITHSNPPAFCAQNDMELRVTTGTLIPPLSRW